MVTMDELQGMLFQGGDVVDRDGRKIGSLGQLFLDASTGQPAWVTVNTGMFGTGESFVPLSGATVRGDVLHVPFDKAEVKHAPRLGTEGALSADDERELRRHYGLRDDDDAADGDTTGSEAARPHDADDARRDDDVRPAGTVDDAEVAARSSHAGHPVDARVGTAVDVDAPEHQVRPDGTTPVPPPPPTADPAPPLPGSPGAFDVPPGSELDPDARAGDVDRDDPRPGASVDEGPAASPGADRDDEGMVLRGEHAKVIGTERVPTERVRLRRYTVTEERTITVPVTREEFRVEYEPADGAGPLSTEDDPTSPTPSEDRRP